MTFAVESSNPDDRTPWRRKGPSAHCTYVYVNLRECVLLDSFRRVISFQFPETRAGEIVDLRWGRRTSLFFFTSPPPLRARVILLPNVIRVNTRRLVNHCCWIPAATGALHNFKYFIIILLIHCVSIVVVYKMRISVVVLH